MGTHDTGTSVAGHDLSARLSELGFAARDVQAIVDDGGLAAEPRSRGDGKGPVNAANRHRPRFTPPIRQLAKVSRLNAESAWGFSPERFAAAAASMPPYFKASLCRVPVLVVRLPSDGPDDPSGCVRTFKELWRVAASAQVRSWEWEGYADISPKTFRHTPGTPHVPGLSWSTLDLCTVRDYRPDELDLGVSTPAAAVMSAAALHPGWIRHMNGFGVPYVWVPGYQVCVPDRPAWASSPRIGYPPFLSEIKLHAEPRDSRHKAWAVPVFRKA